jgi:hypothetical protein
MEIQMATEPLNIRWKKCTLKLAEKCDTLRPDHWKNYVIAANRLKMQNCHLQHKRTEKEKWFITERTIAF